jgi:hypothetical protein
MAYTTIDDPSEYFQTKIYAGSNNNNVAFTFDGNSDMQPDWLWIKNRTEAQHHAIFDSSRGPTKRILASDTGAETTENTNLDSFDSDGFTLDEETIVLKEGDNFVAWGWKANGGTESGSFSESGNNHGVSFQANQTAGFSICTYTGTGGNGSFAHGLGVIPQWVIFKARAGTENWPNYHVGTGNTHAVELNRTNAPIDNATLFQDTTPTNSSVYIGTDSAINADGVAYVAYCFAPIQGYSKFGTYEGNANANGTFVYTGFRPAMIIMKSADSTSSWDLVDDERIGHNADNNPFSINANSVEGTADLVDILSNGFKLRIATDPNVAETYVFAAWAKHPFVTSEGTPVTAR